LGRNIVQKIIDAHHVAGEKKPGKEVAIRIDQTLTQDATVAMPGGPFYMTCPKEKGSF
jgi:aconitate hydratase